MADPVIISYARGLLKEFPGIPEGHHRRHPGRPGGGRHPGRGRPGTARASPTSSTPPRAPATRCATASWSTWCREWFSEHPLADDKGQPIEVPEWSFPGRRRVQNQLRQATRALRGAERALQALPLRGSQADLGSPDRGAPGRSRAGARLRRAVRRLHRDRSRLRRRPPARAQGPADRRRTRGVLPRPRRARLAPLLPRRLPARPSWPTPGCAWPGLGATGPGPSGLTREERGRRAVLSPDRQLAVFDLENTLVATNVVDSYAWLATRHMGLPERARFTVRTLLEAPRMLSLDMVDRGDFLRWFYRRYENADLGELCAGSMGADQRPPAGQVVPGRHPPGARAPRARPPDAAHHRCAGLRHRALPRPCSTTSSAPT